MENNDSNEKFGCWSYFIIGLFIALIFGMCDRFSPADHSDDEYDEAWEPRHT